MGRLQLFRCKQRTLSGKRRIVFSVGGLESVRRGRVVSLELLEAAGLRMTRVVVLTIVSSNRER